MAVSQSTGRLDLPSKYKEWPKIAEDLKKLAEKKVRGVDAFEDICAKHDRWEQVRRPFSLLRRVLSDDTHVTKEFFCESLLPWIAGKALKVEELFKDTDQQLPVCRTKFIVCVCVCVGGGGGGGVGLSSYAVGTTQPCPNDCLVPRSFSRRGGVRESSGE